MKRKDVIAWIFYDFATTPVAFAVNSMYLPLLIIAYGGSFTLVGILPLITAAAAALWTPLLGSMIDTSNKRSTTRRIIIILAAVISSACIIMIAIAESVIFLILSFIGMSLGIQTGWTAINSYFASEGDTEKLGALSGTGVLFGYLGGGIGALGAVIVENILNRMSALIFVAAFLLIFAIIPGIALREYQVYSPKAESISKGTKLGITTVMQNKNVKYYLLASVLWGDAVSTIMTFASIIAVEVLLIPEINASIFLAMALPGAMIGALLQGKLGDRYGIVRVLLFNLVLWSIGIGTILFIGGTIPNILIASIAGFALGGNIALSRALYAKLIPHGLEGSLFGISGIFALFGGTVGPLLTGVIADIPGISFREALFVPLIFVILSVPILNKIKE